jgi:lipopolysaccharide export LptBFGC system permease protein LptF
VKLNRLDILALVVLAMGLLVMAFSPSPRVAAAGLLVSGVGLAGCVLSFFFGDES